MHLYTFSLRVSNLFTLRNSKAPGLGTNPQNHRILALTKNKSIHEMFGLLKIVALFFVGEPWCDLGLFEVMFF